MIYNLLTIGKDIVLCERCGERVGYANEFDRSRKYCSDKCAKEALREQKRTWKQKQKEKKLIGYIH